VTAREQAIELVGVVGKDGLVHGAAVVAVRAVARLDPVLDTGLIE